MLQVDIERREQEVRRLKDVYQGYFEARAIDFRWSLNNPGNAAIKAERSGVLLKLLRRTHLLPLSNKQILEIGCGAGGVLQDLISLGANASLLTGVDLISDRIELARRSLRAVDLRVADGRDLPFPSERFDLVVAFTTFSSILNLDVAGQVAQEVRRVLKPGGAVLWYDLRVNNPRNANVCGRTRHQVLSLFPHFCGTWRSLTLLPPLARRLGATAPFSYPCIARIPFLRTHWMAVLQKPTEPAPKRPTL